MVQRWSKLFVPTLREAPADAEVASHKLLLRGGYIRQLGAGIYSYLFLGNRSINKIVAIVREEMDRIGQEFLLPTIHPKELWEESGRWTGMGENMFRLTDRKGAELCLGMTHEEVMTSLARNELRSYKQLPQIWYQIQTKFRDEPRPKSGLMRVRQFLMKDSYSFDLDEAGLDTSYNKHDVAYRAIFTRCGLDFVAVEADSGAMGGSQSQEFMVYTEAGEDLIASCSNRDYSANLEKASTVPPPVHDLEAIGDGRPINIKTPGASSIEDVVSFLRVSSGKPELAKVSAGNMIKTLAYMVSGWSEQRQCNITRRLVVLLRGDQQLNETKIAKRIAGFTEMQLMSQDQLIGTFGASGGSIGPLHLKPWITQNERGGDSLEGPLVIIDDSLKDRKNLIAGANEDGFHLLNLTPERDLPKAYFTQLGYESEIDDPREVNEGDPCPVCRTGNLHRGKAMEIGHIFKLGFRYSKTMGATVLNKDGKEVTPIMGSYGIGIERILTAAIETSAAKLGGEAYALPPSIAPFAVVVTVTNVREPALLEAGESIAAELHQAGIDVLLDDRDERAGVKFKDADLIGVPFRIAVGKKLTDGHVELLNRLTGVTADVPTHEVVAALRNALRAINVS